MTTTTGSTSCIVPFPDVRFKVWPKRIYIAGPLTSAGTVAENIQKAVEIAQALRAKGHYFYCPHTHTTGPFPIETGHTEYWMGLDKTFMDHWAQALFFIAPSFGACRELGWAEGRRLEIFRSLDEVPNVT